VQPLHTILAVQTGGSAFKVFPRAELNVCQLLGSTYFCPNNNILDKRTKTNCVLGLFNRDQEVIMTHCPWISIAATDFNIQLGANIILLYLANSKEVQLVYVTTDTIIQNYLFHHYYNYVYMNKTIRFKKRYNWFAARNLLLRNFMDLSNCGYQQTVSCLLSHT
jgi:hypothetical protein